MTPFAIFVFFIPLAFTQETKILRPRPPPIYFNDTPTGPFNPLKEKCCLGTVSQLSNWEWDRCCGDKVYDKATELCCKNSIYDLEPGRRCCGSSTYNVNRGICCSGRKVKLPRDQVKVSRCCGTGSYNIEKQLCCWKSEQIAVDKSNKNDDQCCGDKPMNSRKEICCYVKNSNGEYDPKVLKKEGDKSSCCGDHLIDPSKRICCDDVSYPIKERKICCGNESIDIDEQVCCYKNGIAHVVDITSPGETVCCGLELYDTQKQICCNEEIYKGTYPSRQCCNNTVIDSAKQLCCYDYSTGSQIVVDKTDPNQDSCCGTEPYFGKTEFCCDNNKVVKKDTPDANACCGNIAYAYGKGICCSVGKAIKFTRIDNSYNYGCCNLEPYSYFNETCCNGQIYKSKPDYYCCNNEELYNWRKDICCIDYYQNPPVSKVHHKSNENRQSCCGTEVFDYRTHQCCGDKLYRMSDKIGCCGNEAYDLKKEICCGNGIIYDKEPGETDCCYYGTTDKQKCPPIIYYNKENGQPEDTMHRTQEVQAAQMSGPEAKGQAEYQQRNSQGSGPSGQQKNGPPGQMQSTQ